MVQPIYKSILTIRTILRLKGKGNKIIVVPPSSSSESNEDESDETANIVPELDPAKLNDQKDWKRRHTGFAFSGEAGHSPQITDPNFYL